VTDIKILNNKFEETGKLNTKVELTPEVISEPCVHQVVKAILAGKRQGTHSTKTKGLVSGGGSKPFKQKGTGRARQGSSRSPLMVGGGTIFGPTPRDYTQKVNKKMSQRAIQSVLSDKLNSGKLIVVDSLEGITKTKEMNVNLKKHNLFPALIVTAKADSKALRSTRNLQYATAIPVEGFSVYEAVKFENLIIEKAALENLLARLV
jgi:large subunit ribosomal protein L4